MKNLLRRAAHKIAHPFPGFPFAPGAFYSPLETAAERLGQTRVEALFRESQNERAVANAHVRYLGDLEAERALKKGYHVIYEGRLRSLALAIDPPERYGFGHVALPSYSHPLDLWACKDLMPLVNDVTDKKSGVSLISSAWQRLSAFGAGLIFLANAFVLLFRFGRWQLMPRRCRVAAPNFGENRWQLLQQACDEQGLWSPEALLFVNEQPLNRQFVEGKFPILDPSNLPVSISGWLRNVLWPGIRLVMTLWMLWLMALRDSRVIELIAESFRQAISSLPIWRLAQNLRFDWYLDNAEYGETHNLKAIIFRKFGGKLARWPHSQIDIPGSSLSYLGYDVFLAAGNYQTSIYGNSWYPLCRTVSVGHMQHDWRVKDNQRVAPEYDAIIGERLRQGHKMAVFIGPSMQASYACVILDLLEIVMRVIAARDDWFLVIKPKKSHALALYSGMANDPRFDGWKEDKSLVPIQYGTTLQEICPVAWLIERMSFAVGDISSVQIEALTHRKPYFAYRRVAQMTPSRQQLYESGLLLNTFSSLESTLQQFLENPNAFAFPYDWFSEAFDPFGDDQALSRIAGFLFGDGMRSLETARVLS